MPTQPPWRAIIFDLDGTLIDSAQTILGILNEMLEERAGELICMADMRPHLSKGGRQLVAEALGEHAGDGDEDLASFRERYAQRHQGPEIVFPHAATVLQGLSDRGMVTAVCTNKPKLLVHNALKHSGLVDFFDVVVSSEDVSAHKPDPAPLLATCTRLGLAPRDCLYVGDSEVDAMAAERADMDFIFASYGYPVGSLETVRMYGRVSCLSELPNFLGALPSIAACPVDLKSVA